MPETGAPFGPVATIGKFTLLVRFVSYLNELQVEILVDDGGSGGDDGSDDSVVDTNVVVEAGTLGTVVATAVLYDPRLGNSAGCDPDGCTAALTRVRTYIDLNTRSLVWHLALPVP